MGHLISAAAVVDVDVDLEPGWVEVENGTIVAPGTGAPTRRPDEHHDGILAPGLIDAQVNGAFGADFAVATGDDLVEQLRAFRGHRARLAGRAGETRLLGAHVEGPFIAAACKGAHDEAFLVDPTPERVNALVEAGGADLGYVTLAPERAGALGVPELGTLAAGTPADLVVLDPDELRVRATWIGGRRAG